MSQAANVFRFNEFEVDEGLCELRRSGRRVALQRRPLEVLIHLVRNRHRVVSKEELLRGVWGGVIVSDAALSSALRDLRRALGDDGRAQHSIQTRHGFGYRFVAKLDDTPPAASASADAPELDAAWWEGFSRRLVAFVAAEFEAAGAPEAGRAFLDQALEGARPTFSNE